MFHSSTTESYFISVLKISVEKVIKEKVFHSLQSKDLFSSRQHQTKIRSLILNIKSTLQNNQLP